MSESNLFSSGVAASSLSSGVDFCSGFHLSDRSDFKTVLTPGSTLRRMIPNCQHLLNTPAVGPGRSIININPHSSSPSMPALSTFTLNDRITHRWEKEGGLCAQCLSHRVYTGVYPSSIRSSHLSRGKSGVTLRREAHHLSHL